MGERGRTRQRVGTSLHWVAKISEAIHDVYSAYRM
jgi:hypothetical protein